MARNTYALLLLFITAGFRLSAQTGLGFEYQPDIRLMIGSDSLGHPWAGGLNNVQFSDIDIDYDGDMDLLVFDRSGDEISLFITEMINGEPAYVYRHGGHTLFPPDVRYKATTYDYNNDGKKDLFTYAVGGMKVYKNVGNASSGVQWQETASLVYSDYGFDNYTNLYISSSDIAALVDVEGDGDMDILTFHISGETMEYHQNQSMELYGVPDSMAFVLRNECWGKFREDINSNGVTLNDNTTPCSDGGVPNPQRPSGVQTEENAAEKTPTRHAGSTILALDMNANGVLDLVLGDVSYPTLTYLRNGGTAPNTNSAMVEQQPNFPQNTTAANIQLFPAPFYVDVNHDGVKDLIVGANAKSVSQNQKSVLYYENMGADNQPVFSFRSKAFMQGEMIDNGLGSVPVMFDYNGDGKRDLLVANFYRYKDVLDKEASFQLYRNSGTVNEPEYTFVTDNYLNVASLFGQLRVIPAFADIDNDGDDDMIAGLAGGELRMLVNSAGAGNTAVFGTPQTLTDSNGEVISAGAFAAPQLFDLNGDGLHDLIIGTKTGELLYYENTGTPSAPQFTLKNELLGNVDVNELTPDGYIVPHFFRKNDTIHLFAGAYDGKLHYYNGIENHLEADSSFHLVSHAFLGLDAGLYSSFWVEDVDNDGLLNMFVGQDLGGLHLMEINPNSTIGLDELHKEKLRWMLVPNPATGSFRIFDIGNLHTPAEMKIYSVTGQLIFTGTADENTETDISLYNKGMYIVRLTTGDQTETHRLIKQ